MLEGLRDATGKCTRMRTKPTRLSLERTHWTITRFSLGDSRPRILEVAWEAGKFAGPRSVSFTGPPPGDERPRLEAPPPGPSTDERRSVVERLCGDGVTTSVQWISRSTRRETSGLALGAIPTSSHTWAAVLECCVGTKSVRFGASGRGSGSSFLASDERRVQRTRQIERLADARVLDSARCGVVFAPAAAAVLFHEALGHFAEGHSSIDLSHRIGLLVASGHVCAVDNPLAQAGPAHYGVDDEGTMVMGPTVVVEDGRLVGMLHTHQSARASRAAMTANGRSASAWHDPVPRASNLIVSPGAATEDDLLAELSSGLFIHRLADGFSYGNVVEAEVVLAETVVRGRRTGVYLTGGRLKETRTILRRVAAVGAESVFHENALCGKAGQMLFDVGTAAPAVLVNDVTIEGHYRA